MADATAALGQRSKPYHFAIRRLHSLSGIIPVGVFLCIHLSINASILAGAGAFQFAVDQIHNLDKIGVLKVVEVVFIIVPIVFHAVVGVLIWLSGDQNLRSYRYGGNLRYTLQRWTGIIAMVFILLHLWHVHWIIPGGSAFDPHAAAQTAVAALAGGWTGPVYALGVLCAVFHLANGVWTFLITWGLTIGPRSQRFSGRVCIVIGVLLALLGLGSLMRFKTMEAPPVPTDSHAARAQITMDLYG